MTPRQLREQDVEEIVLGWFRSLKYETKFGPSMGPGEPEAERLSYGDVVLVGRLKEAIDRLNPKLPTEAKEDALRRVLWVDAPSLVQRNEQFHQMLVEGVPVEFQQDGRIIHEAARLIDWEDAKANDWLAVNQFTVVEERHERRPDIVVFINGLPIGVIELKDPTDEQATIWTAYTQLQTYKNEIPSLFAFNEVLVVSDGMQARIGSLTADKGRFMPWRTIEGDKEAGPTQLEMEVLIRGIFEKRRLLQFVRHFVVFEPEKKQVLKKLAGYHQFHAVNRAVETTVAASRAKGDRRCGVVWHTQGSGKSLTMVFYAGRIVLEAAMQNPTLVVLTDRNDLDDQLFGTFARCHKLLRQKPVQAQNREDLKKLLEKSSGGIVFTTIQKFLPEKGERYPQLSDRRNIVVIADEAHRSQYDFIDGFARHMRDALPNASFIGFTGTPLELQDKNTRAVFGDYISVYDIQQAVKDGATVPIYYEGRLAKLELKEKEKPKVTEEFEEVTEGEELERKEKLKTKWAALETLVGTEKRLGLIAKDLVEHFERRLEAMDGKGMIVCMSRRICVDLYNAIIKIRPTWRDEFLKVVMTGSASDPPEWQEHIRNKAKREKLAEDFKDDTHPFKLVIVRDMWLTGFDVPCLHTMYVDKPMRGHGLMQAIARVNRVYKDKPGGLIVDYLGLADQLKRALADYTGSGGRGKTAIDQAEAVAVMLERFEVCADMFHGFDYSPYIKGTPADRLAILPRAQQHILRQEDGKERFVKAVVELSKAFALSVPHEAALRIRDDVEFFQAVKAQLVKYVRTGERDPEELEQAIRQIVSKAIVTDKVVDIFAAAGLKKPDISILSEEFLAEVREMPHKNLAVELLQKLLKDEIKVRSKKNLVQSRAFGDLLEQAVRKYQNRSIETAQVIEELVELARKMREAQKRGEDLGLGEEELAFYDALETNDSAVKVLGDETLRTIARELVRTVRRNTTIDWAVKESAQAKLRVLVKRVLKKYGYPPDKQEKATRTVLEQAKLLSSAWEVLSEPFKRLSAQEAKPYKNCIPLYSLKAAASGFGIAKEVEYEGDPEAWVAVEGVKPAKGYFVAQVVGESMNRRIPNSSYCLFRAPVEGDPEGKVVLVQHHDIRDPEHGASFTVKVYESGREKVTLRPDSTEAAHRPIVIESRNAEGLRVIAELVRVL